MSTKVRETKGAWVVHHGQKVALDVRGAAEYPAIDEAAKAATLISRLAETNETVLSSQVVQAIATTAGLNPRHELNGLLQLLEKKRLIEQSQSGMEIAVLGVTTRAALQHAADIFDDASPSPVEEASIKLAEAVSSRPSRVRELNEAISDEFFLSTADTKEFFDRAEKLGFVDGEGQGDDRLLFNGNLFRRDSVEKASRVLSSLTVSEQQRLNEVQAMLEVAGCLGLERVEAVLGTATLDKLVAAGFYDLNVVGNESGEYVFVTAPGAFHKYVDPLIDDCFDMAKSLVAALTYGMTKRGAASGRIMMLSALLGKLVRGHEIGSATAIGQDYRVLEMNRVVALRIDPTNASRFFMRLLKREVGELALQVLQTGTAAPDALGVVPTAPMVAYRGPEASRSRVRKHQLAPSRKGTRDVLEVLRGGRVR